MLKRIVGKELHNCLTLILLDSIIELEVEQMTEIEDIKKDVDKLKEKVTELEKGIVTSLGDIKVDLTEIKGYVKSGDDVMNEKMKNYEDRISKLEDIVSKITWSIVLEVIGLVGAAVVFYIKSGI